MNLVLQILAWCAVAVVVVALLVGLWWLVSEQLAARRDDDRRGEQLSRALARSTPWVTVPRRHAPRALDTCHSIAWQSGYRLLGIERSRGLLRRPQLVFVPHGDGYRAADLEDMGRGTARTRSGRADAGPR